MAYFNLGNTYQDLKKYNLAIKSFLEVLRIDSLHADALFNLAVAFQDRGAVSKNNEDKREDLLTACRYYEQVYQARPDIQEAKKALDSLKCVLEGMSSRLELKE